MIPIESADRSCSTGPTFTLDEMIRLAERLDSLGDTAELMGDDAGAQRFRGEASARRAAAMDLLDR